METDRFSGSGEPGEKRRIRRVDPSRAKHLPRICGGEWSFSNGEPGALGELEIIAFVLQGKLGAVKEFVTVALRSSTVAQRYSF
jgi:hypothetical protein